MIPSNFYLSNYCTPYVAYNFSLLLFVQEIVLLYLHNCNVFFEFSFYNIFSLSSISTSSQLVESPFSLKCCDRPVTFLHFFIICVCLVFINPFLYYSSIFSNLFLMTIAGYLVYDFTCTTTFKRFCW